ncbi:ribonuclease P protein component [Bhargavaea beijingensis]|uniref:Ribonuclease P protein component n=1 Tax=Bhargavaea beijingensis TaxID=426756 RepID=A0A1G7ESW0_9BACL|nr:ribonuclease P protein component [Bhargavaea beijingensis]MCW1929064.1 ribonuclease P protein component [Bhargavaea beijingensis]RSK34445.1 ribonuclease P protein component [Bhargavaea beijingensis]SDE66707.1 ribonuclease P protein component [Bhargavaea beijingensis]
MNKHQRVKKNKDFQKVFKQGKSFANRQFVIYSLRTEGQEEFRLGISVSKKVGNAVTRNRIKRYVRQAVLELKDDLRPERDYIIIARNQAASLDFHETKKSLMHVMRIARVLRKK